MMLDISTALTDLQDLVGGAFLYNLGATFIPIIGLLFFIGTGIALNVPAEILGIFLIGLVIILAINSALPVAVTVFMLFIGSLLILLGAKRVFNL